jgi:hypothetical protein
MRRRDLRILYISAYDVPAAEAIGKILRKPVPLDALVQAAASRRPPMEARRGSG